MSDTKWRHMKVAKGVMLNRGGSSSSQLRLNLANIIGVEADGPWELDNDDSIVFLCMFLDLRLGCRSMAKNTSEMQW
uniref:Uncharacterized protein n=1 Tax=Arundo donax TaxID=35708 RepID=A0A0A9EIW9_ARUDO